MKLKLSKTYIYKFKIQSLRKGFIYYKLSF